MKEVFYRLRDSGKIERVPAKKGLPQIGGRHNVQVMSCTHNMGEVYAGVDLGGTTINAVVTDLAGQVLASRSIATRSHDGPDTVIGRIAELVQTLLSSSGTAADDLRGLGMGVPGLVDRHAGTTKFLPNLPTQWRDVPVVAMLRDHLRCPVRLLNDVRTATLGELRFGHGKDWADVTMAFFSLGTGVGGGVVIDGQLRLGPLGSAGEIGHQTIVPDGAKCGCGNRGCLETLASGPAIAAEGIKLMRMGLAPRLHEIVDGIADRVTPGEMAEAAEEDSHVHDALVRAATFIGIAAANVVTTLHPDLVVLGGGVAELGKWLTDTVSQVVTQRVGMFPTDNVQVVQSKLGAQAGVMGAIVLAEQAAQ